jgi:hypothetical protein
LHLVPTCLQKGFLGMQYSFFTAEFVIGIMDEEDFHGGKGRK